MNDSMSESAATTAGPGRPMSPAPMLLSVSGEGRGQGAILHSVTHQLVSSGDPLSGPASSALVAQDLAWSMQA